ncbi:cytochrome c [Echinicola strongylocentroti]|uniref:Cytochrome c n=1 Tax=Echinicola strongylocentroti TaxID=1795355 RepID=A0A2Z4INS9_9BACT|nr:cytochrome c [Echinicola strongylocentroti]AWW32565.1 cytochrome c [Echinicola strongylocentroti]
MIKAALTTVLVFTYLGWGAISLPPQDDLKASIKRGEEVYKDFCITCHMPDGKGVEGTFPPLAGADFLLEKRKESIHAIKYGLSGKISVNGQTYNNTMTNLRLYDDEVADVMNYILNTWGNKSTKKVTEKEVKNIEEGKPTAK